MNQMMGNDMTKSSQGMKGGRNADDLEMRRTSIEVFEGNLRYSSENVGVELELKMIWQRKAYQC